MVTFLSRWDHQYTIHGLVAHNLVEPLSYDQLFQSDFRPKCTHIFADIDRLGPWEKELAARIYRSLKDGGARVLNDPAKVLTRGDMLRVLHREGINSFGIHRPHLGEWPQRYPVFVRRDHFHTGVLSDLLHDEADLKEALNRLSAEGIPDSNLICVEYCAEPTETGAFRKYAVHRIGNNYFRDLSVNESHWAAKYGEMGAGGSSFYRQELREMHDIPHLDVIKRVFALANIDFGRLDYGMVDGKPQFYEINTNPCVRLHNFNHPFPERLESHAIFKDNYMKAVRALYGSASQDRITLDYPQLVKKRVRNKLFRKYRSQPSP